MQGLERTGGNTCELRFDGKLGQKILRVVKDSRTRLLILLRHRICVCGYHWRRGREGPLSARLHVELVGTRLNHVYTCTGNYLTYA